MNQEMREKLEQLCKELRETTAIPSIVLKIEEKPATIYDSKLGGVPYMPKDFEYPHDTKGNPLKLLAQLNFNQLPKLEDYPEEGILQFYILPNWEFGMNYNYPMRQDTFRVVYHKEILNEELLIDEIPEITKDKDYGFPFEGEYLLTGEIKDSYLSAMDFRFKKIYDELYDKCFSDDDSQVLADEVWDGIFENFFGEGHRVGGYPAFTQDDPRDRRLRKYDTTLLTLGSEYDFSLTDQSQWWDLISWGDAGIANFLISYENLKALDFSDVMYTWDCH